MRIQESAMTAIIRMFRGWRGPALLIISALLLAGCVTTSGYGGYPGRYGGNANGNAYGDQLLGSVQRVDRGANRIILDVQGRDRYGADRQVAIQYDNRTRLRYQGRNLAVEGLERGDVIRVDTQRYGNRLLARSIEVVRNVRNQSRRPGGSYGTTTTAGLRGAVAYIDQSRQLIGLDAKGYGGNQQVRYDSRTVVEFRGRRYRPESLERGDVVRVQARRYRNQWVAQYIWVERDSTRY